ncbi:hypothetical protein B0H65DRAFT_441756 [Neurospora tetraspora]|uniref:Uncharacterized protein n=1 Tax=Neurospora tetraspora TaxID=94610 RepID=A0AAE0JIC8_9PEZI|nr:hypothetical protein B0H65DRAFT_441756 [Neurospora tetraspora]
MADLNPQEKRIADDDVEHGILNKEQSRSPSSTTPDQTPESLAAAEASLSRKQDSRIVPLSASIYFLCYLDRSNIGNAKILNASLKHDMLTAYIKIGPYQF